MSNEHDNGSYHFDEQQPAGEPAQEQRESISISQDPRDPEGEIYSIAAVSRLVGLPRSRIDYLARLGLVNPRFEWENRREVRKFTTTDVSTLRKAKLFLDAGSTPQQVLRVLRPTGSLRDIFAPDLLTPSELEVIKRRQGYGPGEQAPQKLEAIAADLDIARQTVHELQKSADSKLERAYLTYLASLAALGDQIQMTDSQWIPDEDTVREMVAIRKQMRANNHTTGDDISHASE